MNRGEDYAGVAVVFYCHDGQGNVLLHKRSQQCRDEKGCWDAGGGGLEFGDTVLDTLKKEIAEEFCTDVLEYDFLGYRDVHREHEGKKTHWVALDFIVRVDRKKARIGEPHKFDEIGWYRLGDFPTPLHSQFPLFLEKYDAELRAL